jgi:porphobilinogen deaminase
VTVRLGTRGSQLALIQAEVIANLLRQAGEEVEIERWSSTPRRALTS